MESKTPRLNRYGNILDDTKSVVRKAECPLPIRVMNRGALVESMFRMYVYQDSDGEEHLAVIKSIGDGKNVPIRIHSSCLTAEIFGATNCDCREQLDMSLQIAHLMGSGGVVYLHQEGRGNGLVAKAMQLDIMLTRGVDTVTAFVQAGFPKDVRNYKIAVDILNDLGISSIQIITNNPDKMEQIQSLGIVINSRIPCIPDLPERNPVVDRDLTAKRTELGHLID